MYVHVNVFLLSRIVKAPITTAVETFVLQYVPYLVQASSGKYLRFRLCDTRGLEENEGLEILVCSSLLDGHIPEDYEVSVQACNVYTLCVVLCILSDNTLTCLHSFVTIDE